MDVPPALSRRADFQANFHKSQGPNVMAWLVGVVVLVLLLLGAIYFAVYMKCSNQRMGEQNGFRCGCRSPAVWGQDSSGMHGCFCPLGMTDVNGQCVRCGKQQGDPCCDSSSEDKCPAGFVCVQSDNQGFVCKICGSPNQPCCLNEPQCVPGYSCGDDNTCH